MSAADVSDAIFTFTPLGKLASVWDTQYHSLVPVKSRSDVETVHNLIGGGLGNIVPLIDKSEHTDLGLRVTYLRANQCEFEDGDVVCYRRSVGKVEVLMRASDMHHTVFLTNRCNSRCVMCSQPPSAHDDSWRIQDSLDIARQVKWSPRVIGFTGGEPMLLGGELRTVLEAFSHHHPEAFLEVLTNGRLAQDVELARFIFSKLSKKVCWMVPLYGHAPFLHDYVVQTHGAFDETLCGLLNMQRFNQAVQLRIVLIRPVLELLPALAGFVAKNLPFVREVALMGCEPIGFALANRSDCEVDLADWASEIRAAVQTLERGQVPAFLLNIPHCAIGEDLWEYTHQSISDWKRVYSDVCTNCAVQPQCCGLFAWHQRGWSPTRLRPVHADRVGLAD